MKKKNPLLALAMMVSCVQGHASGAADALQDRRSGEAETLILCVCARAEGAATDQ